GSDPRSAPTMVRSTGTLLTQMLQAFGVKRSFDFHTDFGLHCSFFWAIPISFVVVGGIGYLLEVCLIRFLYGRPLDTLLATWGVSLVLQQLVRLLFEADLKPLAT